MNAEEHPAGMKLEQRREGLTADETVLLLADEVLHRLSVEFIDDLPYAVRADVVRRRWCICVDEGRSGARATTAEWGADEPAHARAAGARARDIVIVLEERGVWITDEQKEQILACTDPDVTHRWLRNAATAERADDVFAWVG